MKRAGVSERRERQMTGDTGKFGEDVSLKQEGNDGNALSSTISKNIDLGMHVEREREK